VADIRLFATILSEVDGVEGAAMPTGRLIHVPNKAVMEESVVNSSKGIGMLWNEIGVEVTFESDWKKAKDHLVKILANETKDVEAQAKRQLRKVHREYKIKLGNLRPEVFTSVTPSGVHFGLRYLVDIGDRRDSEQRLWEHILQVFGSEDGIDFAYPTRRTFVNHIEGKPDAKAPAWPPAPK